jgi:hypothetical protein
MAQAQRAVEQRVAVGLKQESSLIQSVMSTVIVDKLVPPAQMLFSSPITEEGQPLLIAFGGSSYRLHAHAFGQMCAKVNLPMNYANGLRWVGVKDEWKPRLLAHILNEHYHQPEWKERSGQTRFLHRIVDHEVRGFLSRRYNRFLASAPLLTAFVDACRANGAKPIEATHSSVRSALKCIMPQVYEPFPGEYICVGVEWSNSDFGAGKLAVSQTVWRVLTGSSAVLDESISRVHLGSIIEDSDLEMSDDTARKEVTAQQSAIADVVAGQTSAETIDRLLAVMRKANEEQIPWNQLKTRLKGILTKSEQEWVESSLKSSDMGIIDLPPISHNGAGFPQPTSYWAASVMALLAGKCEDEDRKLDLQREAGKLLGSALKR